MVKPLVSVIIPNYNYARYLSQTINSVLAQLYPNIEIIVIDDGSTDGSQAVLREYGERIRWFQQGNEGVSMARNRGVQESRGEMVAFLDADDVWLPMKLERQVQRLVDEPDLGLVHCGYEEINETGDTLRSRLDGLEGWVAKEMLLFKRSAILAAGSGALVPRSTFDAVGGFDTRLSTAADWDFCYRVAVHQRVGFVPEALFQYRMHNVNMHANIGVMEHDMLIGYDKAFGRAAPEIHRLRRRSYGNLHMVLAGSFFRAGKRREFVRHAVKSLWLTPGNFKRVMGFPLRWWQRSRQSKVGSHPSAQSSSDSSIGK
ncbi:MAG: glycosyltransferase [Acidobacteria bacterium]|nr:glycosyltransferase [Acidobacteriota bacterium]